MRITINDRTETNRKFWDFIEKKSRELQKWPSWMRMEAPNSQPQMIEKEGKANFSILPKSSGD